MKLPKQVANPGLAALIQGSGFPSLERFANAVNLRGWEMHGVKLSYDHVSVKRWLGGSVCQNPDVVAAVLSDAWGITVPATVVWPELRSGDGPTPAHLQPWATARTLENLGALIGCDMLTRREALAAAVSAATGASFVDPIARWLTVPVGGVDPSIGNGGRIGTADVKRIEQSTRYFAATDAEVGGGLSREAAVGQLKYAVDLMQHGSYTATVGNQLLAAVAGLAGMVGWMCHDSGMSGPAQRYLTYGLQAARESTDPRAQLLVVGILADMARHMRWLGRPDTAVRLLDLALNQLPQDRSRFNTVRAILSSQKAWALAYHGRGCVPEVENALALSFDLYAQADDHDRLAADPLNLAHVRPSIDASEAELLSTASCAYLVLAKYDRSLAGKAEDRTLQTLARAGEGRGRNDVLNQIRLARVRFVAGEPEQACDDGERAVALATNTASVMVRVRLRELLADSEPYHALPRVNDLRTEIQTVAAR
ncbi:hypothetical protein [Phytohabitans rumicis]|uniref:Transcriptional regulator n=1 Tax=Phytohabitans rumicis TaxID=1076125 RepID=A0A6V8LIU1_9ACTN|nr:hypothetical protein [Phytohabitans rumicis]GFJ96124.1 hypothetical protein Prum_097660 [Phytohabitans rumicis]